ncbi:hypothetical protein FACS189431_4010 [Alphaproteobacteria bacterium]|nr:hypothetical protein FACS189431_4010 [Alphaproteobacteria bacterium]
MEPQYSPNTAPGFTPEQQPMPATPEQLPDILPTPEAPIASPEQSASAEQLAVDHIGQAIVAIPAQPVTDDSTTVQPVTDQTITDNPTSTPATAGDNDAIEKEWIAKVKQVISSTSSDPHAQQREASRLMADYVLKRFGRKIGAPEG